MSELLLKLFCHCRKKQWSCWRTYMFTMKIMFRFWDVFMFSHLLFRSILWASRWCAVICGSCWVFVVAVVVFWFACLLGLEFFLPQSLTPKWRFTLYLLMCCFALCYLKWEILSCYGWRMRVCGFLLAWTIPCQSAGRSFQEEAVHPAAKESTHWLSHVWEYLYALQAMYTLVPPIRLLVKFRWRDWVFSNLLKAIVGGAVIIALNSPVAVMSFNPLSHAKWFLPVPEQLYILCMCTCLSVLNVFHTVTRICHWLQKQHELSHCLRIKGCVSWGIWLEWVSFHCSYRHPNVSCLEPGAEQLSSAEA